MASKKKLVATKFARKSVPASQLLSAEGAEKALSREQELKNNGTTRSDHVRQGMRVFLETGPETPKVATKTPWVLFAEKFFAAVSLLPENCDMDPQNFRELLDHFPNSTVHAAMYSLLAETAKQALGAGNGGAASSSSVAAASSSSSTTRSGSGHSALLTVATQQVIGTQFPVANTVVAPQLLCVACAKCIASHGTIPPYALMVSPPTGQFLLRVNNNISHSAAASGLTSGPTSPAAPNLASGFLLPVPVALLSVAPVVAKAKILAVHPAIGVVKAKILAVHPATGPASASMPPAPSTPSALASVAVLIAAVEPDVEMVADL